MQALVKGNEAMDIYRTRAPQCCKLLFTDITGRGRASNVCFHLWMSPSNILKCTFLFVQPMCATLCLHCIIQIDRIIIFLKGFVFNQSKGIMHATPTVNNVSLSSTGYHGVIISRHDIVVNLTNTR